MPAELGIPNLTGAEEIGRGGFSVVYSATDTRFDRPVAVKVLNGVVDERTRQRFERECRVMGRLSSHPNVVTIYDAGQTPTGHPYLVMELVTGGTLADRLRTTEPVPWRQAAAYLVPVLDALHQAHVQGVLHRDVKPENILLDTAGVPRLTRLRDRRPAGRGRGHVDQHHRQLAPYRTRDVRQPA